MASYSEDHPQDDALNALWNDLNRRVFSLIHSNQSFEIRGGITAIERLLETKKDVAPEKHMQRVLRFYHCKFRNNLPLIGRPAESFLSRYRPQTSSTMPGC